MEGRKEVADQKHQDSFILTKQNKKKDKRVNCFSRRCYSLLFVYSDLEARELQSGRKPKTSITTEATTIKRDPYAVSMRCKEMVFTSFTGFCYTTKF